MTAYGTMNGLLDRQLRYAQTIGSRADEGPPYEHGEFAAALVREIRDAIADEDQPIRRQQRLMNVVDAVSNDDEVSNLYEAMKNTPAIEHCHEQMMEGADSTVQPFARIPVAFSKTNATTSHLPHWLTVVDCLGLWERIKLASLLIVVDVLDVQHRASSGMIRQTA